MRYHHLKPESYTSMYGETYYCEHPLYDKCTLYLIGDRGLAVIQQRFSNKKTYWEEIDPWLTDAIYLNEGFYTFFESIAEPCDFNGLYPTVSVRSLMHTLKMKPIPKESWETVFDRKKV